MPHLHDESIATSESDVVPASSRDKPEDRQPTDDGNGPSASPSCETKVVDRLLSLAATATRHAPLRETEASNESPNIIGTKATGVGQHPAVTPSPFNALNRSQQDQEQSQQQERTGTNPLPSLFPPPLHYNGPMYSVYHGTKAIVSSPIRGRSPPAKINQNDDDEQHLTTTIPQKPVLQASKNDKEVDADRCASPPRTRKVTTLEQFHRFAPSHHPHHPYHHGMVGVYGSMILPQSPIHHQRIHNGQAPGGAGTAVASSPFHWPAYPQHHPYHPYMTTTFPPSMMHADGSTASSKRSAPLEVREDEPSAKRRLSLPVQESARTVSGDSRAPSSSSLRETSNAPEEPKKDEPKSDKTSEDESTEESLDSKRAESKDEKQRVISPSSSNDGGREEDDEFSNSTTSCIPPRVEFGARGVSTSSKGGYPPPPPPMMPHPVHHARTMRGAHAMYSPFHHHLHHHQHHPAMHMGYPPVGFASPPQYGMHPAGWYAMGPPSGPPFPYTVMSRMGSTQPPTGTQPSSQQTSRAASPAFPAKTLFPHRGPPLSPVRSPNRDAEEVTPDTEDRKEAKKVDANVQPLPCVSQASSPEAQTSKISTSSQPIKSVADWQKATIATGMAPSANRCVPLKAPIPTKYWGESSAAKDVPLPDFHRLVNFPDYLTKSRPNQTDGGGGGVGASKANGQRHCVMCGTLRLCSAATSQLASSQRSSRKKGNAGDDDQDDIGKKNVALPATTTHIIPRQNKGLCTACDVTVWVVSETGTEIKWCKGCKNFRPWVAFGDKGLATKCVRCRDRQREKYALQKEESGRVGRRQLLRATTPSESILVGRGNSSTPQQQQQTATPHQEDGDDNEDDEHVAAARGLRNLMAASI